MLGSEGGPGDQDKGLNLRQRIYLGNIRAYQERLSHVDEVRARLNITLLESEAVWDGELKLLFAAIFKLQHELMINVRRHLITANPDAQADLVESYRKILAKDRDVLYESPLEGDDVFKYDLDAALSKVEDYLRDKLIK